MDQQTRITSADFFSNAAAREAGFTEDFWYQVYQQYLHEADRDPSRSLEKCARPRTVRMPFKQGYVDVVARVQPEQREYRIVRFTAFPAEGEGESEAQQMDWWYRGYENRPALGEGALLDDNVRW